MTEEQYRSLCAVCDRILLAPGTTVERVAIPGLHVIREHPVFLARYPDASGRSSKRLSTHARQLRTSAVWPRQVFRAMGSTGQLWHGPEELPRGVDFLLVSHLLNADHAGRSDDFYFAHLPDELAARGRSVVVALVNHTTESGASQVAKWTGGTAPRVVFARNLDLSVERALRGRLARESRQLRALAQAEKDPFARRVILRVASEALEGVAQVNLRLFRQVAGLAAELRPKAVVTTFEGHAYERLVFAAARGASPGLECIGYHHAVLFPLQHAIRRRVAGEYDPDRIVTAGASSRAQLELAPGLADTPISVLGSNRGGDLLPVPSGGTEGRHACLVLPEGLRPECHLLFEFSLACARALPQLPFIWRLHPLVSFESLASKNPKLRAPLPPNVTLSDGTLEGDVGRSAWVLYRGTTAVVKAVLGGTKPIYLTRKGEMPIDPLYGLQVWRERVSTVEEFVALTLEGVAPRRTGADGVGPGQELDQARAHCLSLFSRFDVTALLGADH
jgi:hypothetical protein